jgi:hypothetical protein
MKKYCKELRRKRTFYVQLKEERQNELVHVLRGNSRLKHVTERQIEGTGRQGRRRKQLLDDFEEGRLYWDLKREALYRILCKTRFGRSYRPVVRLHDGGDDDDDDDANLWYIE